MIPGPVVVTLPPDLAHGTQVLVTHYEDRPPTVDVRGGPRMAWTPLAHLGGSFEVRTA